MAQITHRSVERNITMNEKPVEITIDVGSRWYNAITLETVTVVISESFIRFRRPPPGEAICECAKSTFLHYFKKSHE